MSRWLFILALAASTSFGRINSIAAQELGTPDEAKAMLDGAIAELKSAGSGALSKFNDPSDQQFHDRDLYIFALMSQTAKSQPIQATDCVESISVR